MDFSSTMNEELNNLIVCLDHAGFNKSDMFGVCSALNPKQMDELSAYIIANNPNRDQVMEKFVEIVKVSMAAQERLRTEKADVDEMKELLKSNNPKEINHYIRTHSCRNHREHLYCQKLHSRALELEAEQAKDIFPPNMPKTLHLIEDGGCCGSLKCALGYAQHILYYPLPLAFGILPRGTSKNELHRVCREFRKAHHWADFDNLSN